MDILGQTNLHLSEEKRRHLTAIIASAVFMPFVLPPVFELILGRPIDEEAGKTYLKTLFDLFTRAGIIPEDHTPREG